MVGGFGIDVALVRGVFMKREGAGKEGWGPAGVGVGMNERRCEGSDVMGEAGEEFDGVACIGGCGGDLNGCGDGRLEEGGAGGADLEAETELGGAVPEAIEC